MHNPGLASQGARPGVFWCPQGINHGASNWPPSSPMARSNSSSVMAP